MAVVINKRPAQDGTTYEIADFDSYLVELGRAGITAPRAKYRILIPTATAQNIAMTDIESQIALYFRLGPASGIDYEFRGA